jgi:hypothetical protein
MINNNNNDNNHKKVRLLPLAATAITRRNITLFTILTFLVIGSAVLLIQQQQNAFAAPAATTTTKEPIGTVEGRDMDIVNYSIRPTSYGTGFDIIGIITNNSTRSISGIAVVGEFFDTTGKLIGVEKAFAEFSELAPGGNSPFKMTVSNLNKTDVDHYVLIPGAQGGVKGEEEGEEGEEEEEGLDD